MISVLFVTFADSLPSQAQKLYLTNQNLSMMNKLTCSSVLLFIACLLGSCDNMTVTTGDGSEKVEGNGKLVTADRQADAFERIAAEGVFNMILSQGDKESIKVEAEENVLPLIETSVEGNTLK